jgi:hypothetical protein
LDWKAFYAEQDQRSLQLRVLHKGGSEYCLNVSDLANDKNVSLEVRLHPFLNFKVLE